MCITICIFTLQCIHTYGLENKQTCTHKHTHTHTLLSSSHVCNANMKERMCAHRERERKRERDGGREGETTDLETISLHDGAEDRDAVDHFGLQVQLDAWQLDNPQEQHQTKELLYFFCIHWHTLENWGRLGWLWIGWHRGWSGSTGAWSCLHWKKIHVIDWPESFCIVFYTSRPQKRNIVLGGWSAERLPVTDKFVLANTCWAGVTSLVCVLRWSVTPLPLAWPLPCLLTMGGVQCWSTALALVPLCRFHRCFLIHLVVHMWCHHHRLLLSQTKEDGAGCCQTLHPLNRYQTFLQNLLLHCVGHWIFLPKLQVQCNAWKPICMKTIVAVLPCWIWLAWSAFVLQSDNHQTIFGSKRRDATMAEHFPKPLKVLEVLAPILYWWILTLYSTIYSCGGKGCTYRHRAIYGVGQWTG